MTQTTRIERDSMGEMQVPVDALWGASTQRAVDNFLVSGRAIPPEVIHALGLLKAACAKVNLELGKLPRELAEPIITAAMEVAEGKHDGHFPVDVYQTGSGTSSNMNANEVIANLVSRRKLPGGGLTPAAATDAEQSRTSGLRVHPNDHVNMGQSSNDTFPTAMHVAASTMLKNQLIPALRRVQETLTKHANDWDGIVKVGRTHLMDATPIRMGQVFSGYARQMELAVMRAEAAFCSMRFNVPIGGTAVGTGINTHVEFGKRVCVELSRLTGVEFVEAENHFEAQATKDGFVSASGQLKTIAVSLSKIAGDIRLLGSGPRCGLGELQLPEIQPGSSIMPGKVNPVICESVIQVAARVIGNDAVITVSDLGGVGSLFELNVAMPVMADALLESIHLLTNVSRVLVDKLLIGLRVNEARCRELMEQSLMMVTSLAPVLGYDTAAKLAKRAMAENKTIRQVVLEEKLLDGSKLDALLDPRSMTAPGSDGAAGG